MNLNTGMGMKQQPRDHSQSTHLQYSGRRSQQGVRWSLWYGTSSTPHLKLQTVKGDPSCYRGVGIGHWVLVANMDITHFHLRAGCESVGEDVRVWGRMWKCGGGCESVGKDRVWRRMWECEGGCESVGEDVRVWGRMRERGGECESVGKDRVWRRMWECEGGCESVGEDVRVWGRMRERGGECESVGWMYECTHACGVVCVMWQHCVQPYAIQVECTRLSSLTFYQEVLHEVSHHLLCERVWLVRFLLLLLPFLGLLWRNERRWCIKGSETPSVTRACVPNLLYFILIFTQLR